MHPIVKRCWLVSSLSDRTRWTLCIVSLMQGKSATINLISYNTFFLAYFDIDDWKYGILLLSCWLTWISQNVTKTTKWSHFWKFCWHEDWFRPIWACIKVTQNRSNSVSQFTLIWKITIYIFFKMSLLIDISNTSRFFRTFLPFLF